MHAEGCMFIPSFNHQDVINGYGNGGKCCSFAGCTKGVEGSAPLCKAHGRNRLPRSRSPRCRVHKLKLGRGLLLDLMKEVSKEGMVMQLE